MGVSGVGRVVVRIRVVLMMEIGVIGVIGVVEERTNESYKVCLYVVNCGRKNSKEGA